MSLASSDATTPRSVRTTLTQAWARRYLRTMRRYPLGVVGGAIILVMVVTGLLADLISPNGYTAQDLGARLLAPSWEHPFGTDHLGRDIFDRIVHGTRVSLTVSIGATVLGTAAATGIGIASGYFGGKLDAFLQRFVDAWLAFPYLVILLALAAILGSGLFNVVLALGLAFTFGTSRVIRSAVIAIRHEPYIEAATVIGCHPIRILFVHILRNIMATIIIMGTLMLGGAILAEASLAFLGIGVPPPHPSWGSMLQGASRTYMVEAPWMAIVPGVVISLAIFGANMLGDALRDVLDPRLRRSR